MNLNSFLTFHLTFKEKDVYFIPIDAESVDDVILVRNCGDGFNYPKNIKISTSAPKKYIILRERLVKRYGGIESVVEKVKSGEIKCR